MTRKKLFFIDYDNTIFSHRTMSIPEDARSALRSVQTTGAGQIILSTGRPAEAEDLAGFFDDRFRPDGIMGANSAHITIGDTVLRKIYMQQELKDRLIRFAMERGYCLMCTYNGIWYVSEPEYLRSLGKYEMDQTAWVGKEDFAALSGKNIYSFFLQAPERALRETEQHFPEIEVLRMGGELGGGDIVRRGFNKASGLRLTAQYLGYDLADTVAIGDSMNDMDMIRQAGLGIAMGNAMQSVRDGADYVTADIDAGGLAQAIRYALSI